MGGSSTQVSCWTAFFLRHYCSSRAEEMIERARIASEVSLGARALADKWSQKLALSTPLGLGNAKYIRAMALGHSFFAFFLMP